MKRRVVKVSVDKLLLLEQMTKGWTFGGDNRTITCVQGLPADAELVNVDFDPVWSRPTFYFTSPSFDEVAEGEPIPEARIELRMTINPDMVQVQRDLEAWRLGVQTLQRLVERLQAELKALRPDRPENPPYGPPAIHPDYIRANSVPLDIRMQAVEQVKEVFQVDDVTWVEVPNDDQPDPTPAL